jgi:thiol-disulfide isomerase/thioredoxin
MSAGGERGGEGAEAGSRRAWLVGGVATVAAAAGAGVAWWRLRPAGVSGGPADALWSLTLDTPAGGELALASLRGAPLLVNFWATWCPPCVEEMPLLDRFFRENSASGWKVLGLAIDQPSSVRQFLARTPVSFPIGMAGLQGTELGRSLGNQTGGLPFTVVIGRDGLIRERKMGQVSPADLARWKGAASA